MGKLIFKDLYLFSPSEKLAKKISFAPGRTIITSDAHDGTDRGKSVIMKALYHTMGADCYFEGKWEDSTKTYILHLVWIVTNTIYIGTISCLRCLIVKKSSYFQ